MPAFTEWQNFYVIAGSWAGALIGWQLVVITLIANMPRVADQGQACRPFLTPTVVHFCSVLPLAVVIAAPLAPTSGCRRLGIDWDAVTYHIFTKSSQNR